MKPIIKCANCENEFLQTRKDKIYCSKKCIEIKRSKTDKYKLQKKNYAVNNAEAIKAYKKEYRIKNIDIIRTKNIDWVKANEEFVRKAQKTYRELNPTKLSDWIKKNPIKWNGHRIKYHLKHPYRKAWRSVLGNTLTRLGKKKEYKTILLLKYSAVDLKNHIEKLFIQGMTWDNWGQWHIDHIKAVSTFDPETPMHIVNALSNLQPLWAKENISKGNMDIYKNNN